MLADIGKRLCCLLDNSNPFGAQQSSDLSGPEDFTPSSIVRRAGRGERGRLTRIKISFFGKNMEGLACTIAPWRQPVGSRQCRSLLRGRIACLLQVPGSGLPGLELNATQERAQDFASLILPDITLWMNCASPQLRRHSASIGLVQAPEHAAMGVGCSADTDTAQVVKFPVKRCRGCS